MNYLYIGLLKSNTLGLIEILREGTNYRRIEMGPGDWFFFNEDKKDFITNAVKVEFPNAAISWGLITYFGIFDSLLDGNFLEIGTINEPTVTYKGDKTEFEIGKLKISLKIFNELRTKIK